MSKPDFFKVREIEFLAERADSVYDKDNSEHVAAKNYIMNSLGTKTQFWSNEIVKSIPDLETYNPRMWSKKGWMETTDGKVQIARFKPYTWARIFRKGDRNKHIFFTVGVDGSTKDLVYKLDYYHEKDSNLDSSQKSIIEKNLPEDIRFEKIDISELENNDWESVLDLSINFISNNLYIYDKLIDLVWENRNVDESFSNFLRLKNSPKNAFDSLPKLNSDFNGVEKDFLQDAIDKKVIGDAGEELVKEFEKQKLISSGLQNLAEKVEIMMDGNGYDVLSFDIDGSEKYIEVKTTKGDCLQPFDYTSNEKIFAENHAAQYFIYRLYNYDEESSSADFFIIKDISKETLMRATTFKVFPKKTE